MKEALVNLLERENIFDCRYIITRGNDAESHAAGDIDILVDHGHSNFACFQLSKYLRANGWAVIDFRELDYLSSMVVANPRLFPGRSVKIDFFGGLGWYGVQCKKRNIEKLFLADKSAQQAAITLAHKVMYAGRFVDRDIRRIKPYLDDALKLISLEKVFAHSMLFSKPIPMLLKWKVRYFLSGYSKTAIPLWGLRIVFKALRSKIFPTRTKGRSLKIISSKKSVNPLFEDLSKIYRASGDSRQPIFGKPIFGGIAFFESMVLDTDSKNSWFKPALILILSATKACLWLAEMYYKSRGIFSISVSSLKSDSFGLFTETYIIDVSDIKENELLTSIIYRIDSIFQKILFKSI